jgi:hypothetical protein
VEWRGRRIFPSRELEGAAECFRSRWGEGNFQTGQVSGLRSRKLLVWKDRTVKKFQFCPELNQVRCRELPAHPGPLLRWGEGQGGRWFVARDAPRARVGWEFGIAHGANGLHVATQPLKTGSDLD